ncbi:hypothetical protein FAM3257_01147 [Lacticaseibacillus paracasei]|nr:hypothetical protein FAM3257_01147 [Lacticaseibacillus paracasei]
MLRFLTGLAHASTKKPALGRPKTGLVFVKG